MHEYIGQKLDIVVRRFGRQHWDRAIATSATASAVASAVARVPRSKRDAIDRVRIPAPLVRKLYGKLSGLGLAGRRKVTGIGPRRAEIIVPGTAVLVDFLDAFRFPSFYYSRAGVRDGIIADLAARNVGAERSRLSRDQRREVEALARRYAVPPDHARKVAEISGLLFTALQPLNGLPPESGKLLEAAAILHDVGHFVSGSSHHKHSYYVVSNSDLAGFTDRERLLIAALCRYHRKSLPNPVHNSFHTLGNEEKRILLRLIPILRLAVNLVLGHDGRILGVNCSLKGDQVVLEVHCHGDIDLEEWGVEQAGMAFRQIYGRPISVIEARE
jgi:exopolyphosphatase/guanosine-5'-triphosphate,3'-diphosphate pyrophosphatase